MAMCSDPVNPPENEFLNCLHGHLDNRHSDFSEQLYILTKLRQNDLKRTYHKMIADPSLTEQIRAKLVADGLPSCSEVEHWLKRYEGNYPKWSRARPPLSCMLPIILVVAGVALTAFGASICGSLAWVVVIPILIIVGILTRSYLCYRWPKVLNRSIHRELAENGIDLSRVTESYSPQFCDFMLTWILARRLDKNTTPIVDLIKEASSIWDGLT